MNKVGFGSEATVEIERGKKYLCENGYIMRKFKEVDWQCYAGCDEPKDGDCWINDNPIHFEDFPGSVDKIEVTIIIDDGGISVINPESHYGLSWNWKIRYEDTFKFIEYMNPVITCKHLLELGFEWNHHGCGIKEDME